MLQWRTSAQPVRSSKHQILRFMCHPACIDGLSSVPIGSADAPAPLTIMHKLKLPSIDVETIQRDDGPPTESHQRRQRLQFFDKQCSEVAQGLFLSGETVARNRDVLKQNGVTHVLNCVGSTCKECFKEDFTYKTYFLQDTPTEDILCVLYDALEFIDDALQQGGRVLVHCSQGVSRSPTLVIAYLMWKSGESYDKVFGDVKGVRDVVSPNIGFTCQLLQWQKRRRAPPAKTRMYRIGPHCQKAPLLLVPWIVTPPKKYENHTWRELDSRFAFIIQTPAQVFVWVGSQAPPGMSQAAVNFAQLLLKYETACTGNVQVCQQGSEPMQLRVLMDPPLLDADAARKNARRASITGEVSLASASSINMTAEDNAMDTGDGMQTDGVPAQQEAAMSITSNSDKGHTPFSHMSRLQLPPHLTALNETPSVPPPANSPISMVSTALSTPAVTYLDNTLNEDYSSASTSAWTIRVNDEHTLDYTRYIEALRAQNAITPGGSDAAVLPLAAAREWSRDMRLSMTGAVPSALPSSPMFRQHLTLGEACETPCSARSDVPLGLPPLGQQSLPRCTSPEERFKKYRRGASGVEGRAHDTGHDSRVFTSLHQSLDDEDMP